MSRIHPFNIIALLAPVALLKPVVTYGNHTDMAAAPHAAVAVRCRKAFADSHLASLFRRRFGSTLDRLLTQCFPPPVDSDREWRFPWWPHLPCCPPRPIPTHTTRALSTSDQRSLARPVGSITRSRMSSSRGISISRLMGTLPVIPEAKS
jgi:hypothetical protein